MPLYLGIDSVYSLDLLSTTDEAYHPPPRWYALPTTRVRAMAITMYTALLLIIRREGHTSVQTTPTGGRKTNHYWSVGEPL